MIIIMIASVTRVVCTRPKLRQFQKFIVVEGLLSFVLSTLRNLRVNKEKREFGGKRALPLCVLLREFYSKTDNNKELNVTSYSGTAVVNLFTKATTFIKENHGLSYRVLTVIIP